MSRKRVVIVGGGLAGLAAAEALVAHHGERFDVTVIESKRVIGGRAGSFDNPQTHSSQAASSETEQPQTEQLVDYCQHVTMGCCTNLLALMHRCGLSDAWRRYETLNFLHPDFPDSRFAPTSWLPAPLHLAATIGSMNFLTWSQQRAVRRGLLKLMRTPTAKLGAITARTWLSQAGQDSDTIRDFWDIILVSALGEQTEFVSMTAARKVIIDGFAAANGSSDVLVPSQPLRQLFGHRLRDVIEHSGVTIESSQRVETIQCDPTSVHAATRCWTADHIVSAVPWHQAGKLFVNDETRNAVANLDCWAEIPASPITGIHLWFDREITDLPHAVLVGTLSQWLFRDPIQSNQRSSGAGHYYQVVISASRAAQAVPKEELIQQVIFELQRLFPASSHAKLLRSQIVTDPQAVFSLQPEIESIRPPARTALPWLHLAGDWIATDWPATMEGAVISGRMAAASICRSENIADIPIDPGLPPGWLSRRLIAD